MTSLIFGTIYMGHHAITEHRREKQRVKNYERWEGLRDEYDEQRRIGREQSRSLDLQRTGSGGAWGDNSNSYDDRPILTLRDQQEANDARTSWRPQESWDGPRQPAAAATAQTQSQSQLQPQPTAVPAAGPSGYADSAIAPQRTGAWDAGMPAPLRVSRQNFTDYDHHAALGGTGRAPRTASLSGRQPQTEQRRSSGEFDRRSSTYAPSGLRDVTNSSSSSIPTSRGATPQPQQQQQQQQSVVTEVQQPEFGNVPNAYGFYQPQHQQQLKQPMFDVEPVESHVPGGRMAELIERGY